MVTAEFKKVQGGNDILKFIATSYIRVVCLSIADGYDLFLKIRQAYRERFPCSCCHGSGDEYGDMICPFCDGTGINLPKEDNNE